jgi:uncharacterized membrane protein YeaQ/YmgE (transglycosylase-associated protein family)
MSLIWTLIIGLLVGAAAKFLMPGRDPGGIIVTALLGVAGAFVAGFVGQELGWYRADEPAGIIGAILGAIVLLLAYRLATRRRNLFR